jgi:hypothetical protein
MAKKLLSEAQVRRFAKLANLSPINEMFGNRVDEEEKTEETTITEEGKMEEGMDAAEEVEMAPEEEPPAEMPEEEPEMEMTGEEEMELTDEEAQAIIDLGKKLEAALGDAGEEEPEPEMPEEEPEMEMAAEENPEEEEIMEALSDITSISEQKEIVEEVARRVAKRLLKAKRAQKQLDEALGKK